MSVRRKTAWGITSPGITALGKIAGTAVIVALLVPLPVVAELDPRKKEAEEAKKARPALDGDPRGGEGHEEYHRRIAMEGEENLKEINRLLEEIQKDLGQKQTDPKTQAKQKAVVERMNAIIEKLGKKCSQCSSSSSPDSNKQDSAQKKEESQDRKQKAEDEKDADQKKKRSRDRQQAQQQKPDRSEKENKHGKVENDRVEDAKPPEAKSRTLADELRERNRWGLLPPKLAEEMLLSTGKEAPPEYREIISRYYRRMTEYYLKSR